ncbi:alkylation response protein AidB-like acyl-CoA dehydrogenase [Nocardioides luteus]|uniref:Acyl-CoA dehydrogenase n=1 Tax=Nocardioides luteus TaxID=1844 RepID=A0ABQ5T0W0_9ACTN|nr:acyl-CoA dehydrogenase family protein [Nocardioides luteus]MDR7310661.1 alkylation response protein AidB-like acyl-CoA dehydrogenase [Nocardioides luteus]GGR41447.1 putative acyl-CoA dehydrogenase [Nocardioides luteus]GLJ69558.1 putative acyl-CoA dehydrogenase [Nocardioides luteus]
MDFSFTTESDDAAELAAKIIGDATSVERLRTVEAEAGDRGRFDATLWSALGEAGLLGLHLPEEHDGAGLGLVELCRVLVEAGRRVAPVPLAVHGPCGLLLAEAGPSALSGVADGSRLLAAAAAEEHSHLPDSPTVTADGETITGVKTLVRAGMIADALLVTASGPDGEAGVYLVEADASGVDRRAQHTSDGDVTALVTFSSAPALRLGGAATAARFGELLTVAAAAELLGVTEGALSLTSSYAKTREQFGRAIGTFQAVSQRLADGFIDVLAQRLTLWQAVWRVSSGLPAADQVAVAKLWAADAAHRLAHTTVHVHGGVGIDLDGEAHRYFTAAKRFEFVLGGASEQALRIGRALAAS